jgi:peptidoglycan/LPS O-acetylase OafA/YrhL
MKAAQPQLLSLIGVRFFLALWVLVFHETYTGYLRLWVPRFPDVVLCLCRTAYIAVSLFFVLSGFVLAYNYPLDKRWNLSRLGHFAIARFGRIYPVYFVCLILMAPRVIEVKAAWYYVKLSVLHFTLLQAWVPGLAATWNYPGWSLSAETFFYASFPFVGVLLWRASRLSSQLWLMALLWIGALAAPLVVVLIGLRGIGDISATLDVPGTEMWWRNLITLNPVLRLGDFCMGIVLARVYSDLQNRNSPLAGRGYRLYVPATVLVAIAILFARHIPYALFNNGLLLPLYGMVVLGFALGGGFPIRFLSTRLVVFLGNVSYPMYLIHVPLLAWVDHWCRLHHRPRPEGLDVMLLYMLAVVVLAAILQVLIAEPANRMLRKRLTPVFDRLLSARCKAGRAETLPLSAS